MSKSGRASEGRVPASWLWPWGVPGVLAIAALWLALPGGSGAAWLWMPLALLYGIVVSRRLVPPPGG